MIRLSRRIVALLAVASFTTSCATRPAPLHDPSAEARVFMEGYEKDLRSGAREALLDRYDRRGAYFLGGGEKEFLPFDSIGAIYRSRWTPPGSFEWRDLSFEVVGPGAVVVTGQFLWGERTGAVLPFSYTALLIRQNGELRIRVEDESVAPEALKATLCRPDSSAM